MTGERREEQAVHICVTCKLKGEPVPDDQTRPGRELFDRVSAYARETGADLSILPIECMNNCSRGCTVTFSAQDRWTYVFGNIEPDREDLPEAIFHNARLHLQSDDGTIPYKQRHPKLKLGTITRIPPLPLLSLSTSDQET